MINAADTGPHGQNAPARIILLKGFRDALGMLGIAAIYYGAAKLGLSMASLAPQVTAVWPPTGIAMAALLLFGLRFWPGVTLGAYLANVTTLEPVPVALGIATGNTLEAVAALWLLRRLAGFSLSVDRLRDVLAFVVLAALSTTVSASIGVTSLCVGGVQRWEKFGPLWSLWWLGDTTGALLVAPLVLIWASRPFRHWHARQTAELATLLVLLAATTAIVFGGRLDTTVSHHPLEYTVFPFIIWGALRFGQPGGTAATFLVSGVAILGTVRGLGPFAGGTLHENLILLQAFMGVVAVTALFLSAAMTERATAERRRAVDFAISQILTQAADPGDAIPQILDAICEGLRWDVGCFWQVDREAGVMRCAEVRRLPLIQAPEFEALSRRTCFKPGVGLPGRVWAGKEATWIPDLSRDKNFPRLPAALKEGLHGAFGFPVRRGEDVLGVIEFFSREIRQPDNDLLRMFATIGSQIGQVIERRRAEERHRQLVEQLTESDRRKDEFLAMLGHELRNPLAPIRNALEILKMQRVDNATLEQARSVMGRQLQHLVRLVDDLLDISRINRGKIQLRKEQFELAAMVSRAVETARPLVDAKGHQLSVSLPAEPVFLEGDLTRLAQVLANLLNNAAKYTERAGRITLTAAACGKEVEIRVRDTGVGIRPELLPRIFDLFVQSARSLERAPGGLGIGLTLVRSLVEMHGGTVRAVSEGPGKGTEMIVRLPVLPARPRQEHRDIPTVQPRELPRHRVLVVDDNVDAAESLARLLQMSGQEVWTAYNGPAALEAAAAHRPDLVLLDIGLPGMSGYEVAEHLRRQHGSNGMLLVAVTGYGQDEDRRRSREAGFDHHLVKPIEPAAVTALLSGIRTPQPLT